MVEDGVEIWPRGFCRQDYSGRFSVTLARGDLLLDPLMSLNLLLHGEEVHGGDVGVRPREVLRNGKRPARWHRLRPPGLALRLPKVGQEDFAPISLAGGLGWRRPRLLGVPLRQGWGRGLRMDGRHGRAGCGRGAWCAVVRSVGAGGCGQGLSRSIGDVGLGLRMADHGVESGARSLGVSVSGWHTIRLVVHLRSRRQGCWVIAVEGCVGVLSKLIRSVKDGAVLSDGKPLLLEASVKKCHLEIESGRDLHGSDSDVLLLSIEHVLAYRLPCVLLGDSHRCTVETRRQKGAQRRAILNVV
mmetsp:Transcript_2404/g.4462  ORF Transcript_2404/g.4462 Transcript_2404/m.4462 type:complete len:300 (-) Transcript_2404:163-1062(-)